MLESKYQEASIYTYSLGWIVHLQLFDISDLTYLVN